MRDATLCEGMARKRSLLDLAYHAWPSRKTTVRALLLRLAHPLFSRVAIDMRR
jgi:hypothetical protein